MSSSAFFMDVSPQYRDSGCPSQCMGMNEYTTVKDMYSFSTDPVTRILAADPLVAPQQIAVPVSHSIPQQFKGPSHKYTGAQMAAIVTGYADNKPRSPMM